MSFSLEVKEEIAKQISSSRHCQIAEIAAYIVNFGRYSSDGISFILQTDKETVIRKVFTLLKKTYNIYSATEELDIKEQVLSEKDAKDKFPKEKISGKKDIAAKDSYTIVLRDQEEIRKLLQSVRYQEMEHKTVSDILIKNDCCRRAFLRGTFLCLGSMSDPAKSYHMEYVCGSREQAVQLQSLIGTFGVDAKITERKKYYVVYIKEGESIVDLLNIMGAHVSLMNLENLRIVKEVRNTVNRRVNCETANLYKTIDAAGRQVDDIIYLRDHYGLDRLPDSLREMAMVRLEHEDASLKELGEYLDPPVGKSGVNHRLRKLKELAEELRES